MYKERLSIIILFLILTFLNMNNAIDISYKSTFGLTIGALLISFSTCFTPSITNNMEIKGKKIDFYTILNKLLYVLGFILMFLPSYLKDTYLLTEFMKKFDSNTLLFLSIVITFLSLVISEVTNTYEKNEIKKEYLKLSKGEIEKLKKEIENLKRGK